MRWTVCGHSQILWKWTLVQVSYLKSYPFSPLLEFIFMKILVENMREAKQKLVWATPNFLFSTFHKNDSSKLCSDSALVPTWIFNLTKDRKKHYSLDVFTNMNTLKAPKRLSFYFFLIVVYPIITNYEQKQKRKNFRKHCFHNFLFFQQFTL